jgi:hypothetical protein
MYHEGKPAKHYRAAHFPSNLWKQIGILRDSLKVLLDDSAKFCPQSLALTFIPPDRVVIFPLRESPQGRLDVSSPVLCVESRPHLFQRHDVSRSVQMILETSVNELGLTRRQLLRFENLVPQIAAQINSFRQRERQGFLQD